jgi:hypothetical protein
VALLADITDDAASTVGWTAKNPIHAAQEQPRDADEYGYFEEKFIIDPRWHVRFLESGEGAQDAEPQYANPISPDHRMTPLQLTRNVGTANMVSRGGRR